MQQNKPHRTYTEAQLLQRMAALCSRSEHCEADIVAKLQAAEASPEAISRIMARLIDEHFIDNSRYAHAFVREKSEYSGWGRRKIEFALRRKGIAQHLISDALEQLDSSSSEQQLRQLLTQKSRSVSAPSPYQRRCKLIRFALSRGFDMDLILKCLPSDNGSSDEPDFFD